MAKIASNAGAPACSLREGLINRAKIASITFVDSEHSSCVIQLASIDLNPHFICPLDYEDVLNHGILISSKRECELWISQSKNDVPYSGIVARKINDEQKVVIFPN